MTDLTPGLRIKSYIERVERLETEKQAAQDDIKDVYAEAKSAGFDVKTLKKLIRLRKVSPDKAKEEMMLLETYASAIQMELFV